MVRMDSVIHPWAAAAPCALGLLAYGCRWEHLLPPDAPRWAPELTAPAASDPAADNGGSVSASKKVCGAGLLRKAAMLYLASLIILF